MIYSIALILGLGYIGGSIAHKLKLPRLVGMMLVGMLIGPHILNILDGSILELSIEIRQIALVIILTRAGLALDITSFKQIGRPAILMSFLPAILEITAVVWLAPILFGISFFEALLMGAVLAAVSPAVIVPRMLLLIDQDYGQEKGVPKLIITGASIDDIFVIVLFYAFLGLVETNEMNFLSILHIPLSMILGAVLGLIVGLLIAWFLQKNDFTKTVKLLIVFSVSLLLMGIEQIFYDIIPISGLLAVMTLAIAIHVKTPKNTIDLQKSYRDLWVFAEIFLFVLVGTQINLMYAYAHALDAVLLIAFALVFRMVGVFACLIGTNLNYKERLFTSIAYLPKATVQASIGGIPLALGIASGNAILTVAALSILLTAPIGAFLIDKLYPKLLEKQV